MRCSETGQRLTPMFEIPTGLLTAYLPFPMFPSNPTQTQGLRSVLASPRRRVRVLAVLRHTLSRILSGTGCLLNGIHSPPPIRNK